MKSSPERHSAWPLIAGIVFCVLALIARPAFASLIVSGTGISGGSGIGVDATGTVSIGASTATGITIGNPNATITISGPTTISATTTLQNLIASGLTISGLVSSSTQCLQANASGVVSGTGSVCGSGGGSGSSTNYWSSTSTGIYYNATGTVSVGNTSITSSSILALNLPQVTINIQSAPYYASGSSATTTLSGTFAANATSSSVASCATFSPNEGVYIPGAGTSGANYIGTVVSCSGATLTVTPAISTTVSSGTLVEHDETNAFQSAINALASTGGTIFVPNGTYNVNGPLQNTATTNAILTLPSIPIATATSSSASVPVPISIVGATVPAANDYEGITTSGAIIQTSGPSGNLIAGYSLGGYGSNFPITFVNLTLENLTFRAYGNPGITMVNGTNIAEMLADNLNFDVGQNGVPTQPLNTNGNALILAGVGDWLESIARNVNVSGYYTGIETGDHSTLDFVSSELNTQGVVVNVDDSVTAITDLVLQDNTYGIVASNPGRYGTVAALAISSIDSQNVFSTPPGWNSAPIDTVYDPSNLLTGYIDYEFYIDGKGTWKVNGASNVARYNLDSGTSVGGAVDGVQNWFVGNFVNVANLNVTTLPNSITLLPTDAAPTNSGYMTTAQPDFYNDAFTARVNNVPGGNTFTSIEAGLNSSNYVILSQWGGYLEFGFHGSNLATTTYSQADALWWRLANVSGTWYGEISPDGVNWVIPSGFSTTPSWSSTSSVEIGFTMYNAAGATGYANFDQISISTSSASTVNFPSQFVPGGLAVGTTTPPVGGFLANGSVQFTSSSTVVTAAIGGSALTAGQCSTATSSIDTSVTTSTSAFITTPETYISPASFNWASQLISQGILETDVCSIIAGTPTSTKYNVKILK
jgi:hypothetical protein